MAGPTTSILADDLKELTKIVTAFQIEFAQFRSRIENVVGFLKWFGAFFAVLVSGSAASIIWNASKLDAKVTAHGEQLGRMDKGMEESRVRMERIEKALDRLAFISETQGAQLGRIDRGIEESRARMERIETKLDRAPSTVAPTIGFDIPDLTKFPQAKESLDKATNEMKKYAQGNEAGVTIKSASARNVTLGPDRQPTGGTVLIVFDLHHRHRTTRDGEVLGLPGIVAYDRHDTVPVEFDLKTRTGKAKLAGGPLDVPFLPKIPWELWVPFDARGS